MLERSYDKQLIEEHWETASAKTRLPDSLREKFFALRGPTSTFSDNRRGFHRYYMRGKSLLERGDTTLGVYTVDLSRQGVGLLSPVPLLPKERVMLRLPDMQLALEVARCRRIDDDCFWCGAKFVTAPERVSPTA